MDNKKDLDNYKNWKEEFKEIEITFKETIRLLELLSSEGIAEQDSDTRSERGRVNK